MLSQKRQQKYFDNITASALVHLDEFCVARNAESLHQFRVDIKKLSALVAVLKDHPSNGKLPGLFKPLKVIFKKAGDIRNMDVNRNLLMRYPFVYHSFLLSQQKIRDKKAGKFIAESNKFAIKIKTSQQVISNLLFNVENKFIQNKCKKYIRKIASTLSQNSNDIDKLHQVRKKMKVLLYTLSFLPQSLSKKIHINKKYLVRVEKSIGQWHDLVLSREVLSNAGYPHTEVFYELDWQSEKRHIKLAGQIKGFSRKVKK